MRVRQCVADGRRDQGIQPRRHAAANFSGNDNISQQGRMRAMLLHGANRNDDRMMFLQEGFDFEIREFTEKYGRRFHCEQSFRVSPYNETPIIATKKLKNTAPNDTSQNGSIL